MRTRTEIFGIEATVRYLRPVLKRAGFRPDPPRPRKGLLRRPVPWSDFRDTSRWSDGARHVSISVDRSEIQVVVWTDGSKGDRIDMDCPVEAGRLGDVDCMRGFTRETLRCVCEKLEAWLGH